MLQTRCHVNTVNILTGSNVRHDYSMTVRIISILFMIVKCTY